MNRLTSFYTKRTVIGVTIATNYWIQYHRKNGQSIQMSPNNESNHRFHLRMAQMSNLSKSKPKEPFTDEWFAPFVSISPAIRMTASDPNAGTDNMHIASGFICDARGFVVTMCNTKQAMHGQYLVRLGDGQHVSADYVDLVLALNLVVLKLDYKFGNKWPVAELTQSNALQMDDSVYTVGTTRCPLHNQVNEGTVFSVELLGVDIKQIALCEPLLPGISNDHFIQHTALNNPRDSGRPLVNAEGQVVGITIINSNGHNIALPVVGTIFDKIQVIINNYEQRAPPLGLVVYWLDQELWQTLEENTEYQGRLHSNENGVLVWDVSEEFRRNVHPLEPFDVITHINGAPVKSMADMYWAVRCISAGQSVTFSVNNEWTTFTLDPNTAPDPMDDLMDNLYNREVRYT